MLGFRKKDKDKELDVTSLNELIRVGRNVLKILFILGIVSLVFLATYILRDWGITSGILTILKIMTPLFIGLIVAWILDPAVCFLEKKGASRTISTIGVFTAFMFIVILLFWLIIPSFANQVQDVIGILPKMIDSVNSWLDNLFSDLTNLYNYDFSIIEENIYSAFQEMSNAVTIGLPSFLVDLASNIISGGVTFILGLLIGFYMMFDFNNIRKQLNFNAVEDYVMINNQNNQNPILKQLLNKVEKRYICYVKNIYKLKRSLYVCCFSNTDIESSIQMWAYYANNYNGYCCTYDINPKTQNLKKQQLAKMFYDHLYPIIYTDKLINVDIDTLLKIDPKKLDSSDYIKNLIFLAGQSKYKKWENESEYRLIFNKQDFIVNGGDISTGLMDFPFLTQLTLGRDISKEKQRQFLEQLKNIEINRISYSYHEYKLSKDWDDESVLHNLNII